MDAPWNHDNYPPGTSDRDIDEAAEPEIDEEAEREELAYEKWKERRLWE